MTVRAVAQPLVLSGPPGRLTGRLAVHNASDERRSIRREPIVGTDITATGSISVILPAGDSEDLTVRVAVAPHTPPGDYHAVVHVFDDDVPIVLQVGEHLAAELEPDSVELRAGDDATTVAIRVTNTGNVAVVIEVPANVPLEPDSLRRLLDDGPGHDAPTVALTAPRRTKALPPGRSTTIKVKLTPPEDLPKGLLGQVNVAGGNLRLRVQSNHAS